jgi:hypothetical protein
MSMSMSMSAGDGELRIGFDNEPHDQVLASLEARTKSPALTVIAIGHQRYLDLDVKTKKNSTEDPPIWNILKEVYATTLQRIEFHFEFRITSHKEEEKYEKAKQRLQQRVSRLAQRLQRKLPEEQNDVSVDGNSHRVEEHNFHVVTGFASILFSSTPVDG